MEALRNEGGTFWVDIKTKEDAEGFKSAFDKAFAGKHIEDKYLSIVFTEDTAMRAYLGKSADKFFDQAITSKHYDPKDPASHP